MGQAVPRIDGCDAAKRHCSLASYSDATVVGVVDHDVGVSLMFGEDGNAPVCALEVGLPDGQVHVRMFPMMGFGLISHIPDVAHSDPPKDGAAVVDAALVKVIDASDLRDAFR